MPRQKRTAAYTLIELITVLMIIGILAGVAVPKIMGGADDAAIEATIQHLKTIALAAELYHSEEGDWPANSFAGVLPPNMSTYLRPNLFAVDCPIGGEYEWNKGWLSVKAAIMIYDTSPDQAVWAMIDQAIDDGNTATGEVFRNYSSGVWRLVYVVDR